MPQQYSPEQIAALQQLYAQQQAGQAGGGEKKPQSLTDIVEGTAEKIKKIPAYKERFFTGLDGIVGSGLRSTAATYAVVSTAAPLLFTNPVTAGLTALIAGTYAFLATNTMYKLCRDGLWLGTYPILRPKKMLDTVITKFTHPMNTIRQLLMSPLSLIGFMVSYPFKVTRDKQIKNSKGEVVDQIKKAGRNRTASFLGKIVGGIGGADVMYPNLLQNIKEVGYGAGDYVRGLFSTPKYAYSFAR